MFNASTTTTIGAVANLVGIFGYLVGGFFVFFYFWNKTDSARRKENDRIAAELIRNLEKKVEQMEADMAAHTLARDEEISELTEKLTAQQREIHLLQGQNEAYLKILTLRDPTAQKVFEEAPEVFKIAKENNKISTGNSLAIEGLTKTIARFIDTLQPVLQHIEESFTAQTSRKKGRGQIK